MEYTVKVGRAIGLKFDGTKLAHVIEDGRIWEVYETRAKRALIVERQIDAHGEKTTVDKMHAYWKVFDDKAGLGAHLSSCETVPTALARITTLNALFADIGPPVDLDGEDLVILRQSKNGIYDRAARTNATRIAEVAIDSGERLIDIYKHRSGAYICAQKDPKRHIPTYNDIQMVNNTAELLVRYGYETMELCEQAGLGLEIEIDGSEIVEAGMVTSTIRNGLNTRHN